MAEHPNHNKVAVTTVKRAIRVGIKDALKQLTPSQRYHAKAQDSPQDRSSRGKARGNGRGASRGASREAGRGDGAKHARGRGRGRGQSGRQQQDKRGSPSLGGGSCLLG